MTIEFRSPLYLRRGKPALNQAVGAAEGAYLRNLAMFNKIERPPVGKQQWTSYLRLTVRSPAGAPQILNNS
jgi:hypothetical protein